jgi:hypothetical protein
VDVSVEKRKLKVISFESWVSTEEGFGYAKTHPQDVPHLLVDRSPCSDPFFDPFAPSDAERQVTVSGLCRCFVPQLGQEILYLTKICRTARHEIPNADAGSGFSHLVVAMIKVGQVFKSHEEAAKSFSPARFTIRGERTPRPPNVIGPNHLEAAVPLRSCLLREGPKRLYTPGDSLAQEKYLMNVAFYRNRSLGLNNNGKSLRNPLGVALCRVERIELNWRKAPVLPQGVLPANKQGRHVLNLNGVWADRKSVLEEVGWCDL